MNEHKHSWLYRHSHIICILITALLFFTTVPVFAESGGVTAFDKIVTAITGLKNSVDAQTTAINNIGASGYGGGLDYRNLGYTNKGKGGVCIGFCSLKGIGNGYYVSFRVDAKDVYTQAFSTSSNLYVTTNNGYYNYIFTIPFNSTCVYLTANNEHICNYQILYWQN